MHGAWHQTAPHLCTQARLAVVPGRGQERLWGAVVREIIKAEVLDMYSGLEKLLPSPHPYVGHVCLREAKTTGDNRKKLI